MILGITGTLGAGKDTVAEYILSKTGWTHFSTSDEIREECDRRGLSKDRDMLFRVANELRAQFGGGVLAERVLEKMRAQKVKNAVVTAIRNPGEVAALKKAGEFIFIHVDAPIELRYQRILSRAREGDLDVTFERFQAQEDVEKTDKKAYTQQLHAMKQLADVTLMNDGTLKELQGKIDVILNRFTEKKSEQQLL